jgi:hypothetical protein
MFVSASKIICSEIVNIFHKRKPFFRGKMHFWADFPEGNQVYKFLFLPEKRSRIKTILRAIPLPASLSAALPIFLYPVKKKDDHIFAHIFDVVRSPKNRCCQLVFFN